MPQESGETETATTTQNVAQKPVETKLEGYRGTFVPPAEIQALIVSYATQYGVSANYLLSVASCESSYNPQAYNPLDSDGLPAHGLYQYKLGTWYYFGKLSGLPHDNIWDAEQQIALTAWAFSTGKARHWGCA